MASLRLVQHGVAGSLIDRRRLLKDEWESIPGYTQWVLLILAMFLFPAVLLIAFYSHHRVLSQIEIAIVTCTALPRVAKFLTVPVYQEFPDYLHITIARPATSEYSVEYTMSTLLARQGTRLWETADLSNLAPAFRNPTAIVCVADGSRVTSFEVATLIDGPGCLDLTEMSIEAVDAAGNSLDPVEILIPMQRCGSCSGTDYHTRNDWRSYTLQTFEVDTSATQFLITLHHSNVGAPNTRSYAGLAIFRARGSAAHAYY